MARAVHVTLCLVLFTAVMEGVNFLSGDGISPEFGVGFCFGVAASLAIIGIVIDRVECPRLAGLIFIGLLILAASAFGSSVGQLGWTRDLLFGPLLGIGIMFPLTYWAAGADRARRGNPRPPISWRWDSSRERRPT